MKPRFEIVEARIHHCGQMARILRDEHREAIVMAGGSISAHRFIRDSFEASPSFCRSWFCDGRLAVMFGVSGSFASADGYVWMGISRQAFKFQKSMIRETRRQLDEMMISKRRLATVIFRGDTAGLRFARFLGFEMSQEQACDIGLTMNYFGRGANNGL